MPQITQIQVRRDTAATWTSTNPTLAEGEIGFETDTGKFKIGAKVATVLQTWTQLLYATNASNITGTTLPAGITSASGLATVGTITSGTWNGGVIANTYTTATSANTNSAIVSRDASGNFSANTITASAISGLATPLSGAQGGTGETNTNKTITLGGNLTTAGAFNTTLTSTGTTSVTLPTSGTLIPVENVLSAMGMSSTQLETLPRWCAVASVGFSTGTTHFTYFTPLVSLTPSNASLFITTNAVGTTGTANQYFAIFTEDASGNLTRVYSDSKTASAYWLAGTSPTAGFQSIPISGFTFNAGQRYAIAYLGTGLSTNPIALQLSGQSTNQNYWMSNNSSSTGYGIYGPVGRMAGAIATQTSIAASYTNTSFTTASSPYAWRIA